MTNEETIVLGGRNCGKTYKITNELQQENTKLKAEIERLKNQNNHYFEQYAAAIDEIERLKSELEQLKEIADMNNPCYQCVRYDQCGYQHSRCNSFESLKGQV